jgi:hypothetical protein
VLTLESFECEIEVFKAFRVLVLDGKARQPCVRTLLAPAGCRSGDGTTAPQITCAFRRAGGI